MRLKTKNTNKLICLASFWLAAILLVIPAVSGMNYVSFKGGFYITLPDNWIQMDYTTVDVFLSNQGTDLEGFGYEAVFSPETNSPFFNGNYLILTIDTTGEFDARQVDSMVRRLEELSRMPVEYNPTAEYLADIKNKLPNFDRENQLVSVLNRITLTDGSFIRNLMMYKLYEKGVATFYFYSPDSLFAEAIPEFEQIVNSFSTENIEAALPAEDVKVADIETEQEDANGETSNVALYIGIAVVLIVIATTRRRRRTPKG